MNLIHDFSKQTEIKAAYAAGTVNLLFYDLPEAFVGEYRSYDAPRLCTILEGRKDVRINGGQTITYGADQFILLPPHSSVRMHMPEHTRALVYEFDGMLIEDVGRRVGDEFDFDPTLGGSGGQPMVESYTRRISALGDRIQEIFNENDRSRSFLIDLTCRELVYELLKLRQGGAMPEGGRTGPIRRALRRMNTPEGAALGIRQIADELHMSPSNFSQQFKSTMGCTPNAYLTELRLRRARQSLLRKSVTETAFELGYDNVSHFISLFKSSFGMTPKQYQLGRCLESN